MTLFRPASELQTLMGNACILRCCLCLHQQPHSCCTLPYCQHTTHVGRRHTARKHWHPSVSMRSNSLSALLCTRNGVIDREELRALLESTDSGSQYSLTVDDCFLHPEVGLACCVLHLKCTLVLPLLMCLFWLQHWLEDDDLDKIMRNYDENGDGGLPSASLYGPMSVDQRVAIVLPTFSLS